MTHFPDRRTTHFLAWILINLSVVCLSGCDDSPSGGSVPKKATATATSSATATATATAKATEPISKAITAIDSSLFSFSCKTACSVTLNQLQGTWALSNGTQFQFTSTSEGGGTFSALDSQSGTAKGRYQSHQGILSLTFDQASSKDPFLKAGTSYDYVIISFSSKEIKVRTVASSDKSLWSSAIRLDCQEESCLKGPVLPTEATPQTYNGEWTVSIPATTQSTEEVFTFQFNSNTGLVTSHGTSEQGTQGVFNVIEDLVSLRFTDSVGSFFAANTIYYFRIRSATSPYVYWSAVPVSDLQPTNLSSFQIEFRCKSSCTTGSQIISRSNFSFLNAVGEWNLSFIGIPGVPSKAIASLTVKEDHKFEFVDFSEQRGAGHFSIDQGKIAVTIDQSGGSPLLDFTTKTFEIVTSFSDKVTVIISNGGSPSEESVPITQKEQADGLWDISMKLAPAQSSICSENKAQMTLSEGIVAGTRFYGDITISGTVSDTGTLKADQSTPGVSFALEGQIGKTQGSGTWILNGQCSGPWTATRLSDKPVTAGVLVDCSLKTPITFENADLEACVRKLPEFASLAVGAPITQEKACALTRMDCGFTKINDASDLSHFPGLITLNLTNNNQLTSVNLQGLPNLQKLNLSHNALDTVIGVNTLSRLTLLNLKQNRIKTLENLAPLIKLTQLDVSKNQLTGITGLVQLVALQELRVRDNSLQNLTGIEKLKNLTTLDAANNYPLTISSIGTLTKLVYLDLSHDDPVTAHTGGVALSQLEGLSNLTQLQWLILRRNNLKVLNLNPLIQLTYLDLSQNLLTSIGSVDGLFLLKWLYLGDNNLATVGDLSKLVELREFKIESNPRFDCTTFKIANSAVRNGSGCGKN